MLNGSPTTAAARTLCAAVAVTCLFVATGGLVLMLFAGELRFGGHVTLGAIGVLTPVLKQIRRMPRRAVSEAP